MFSCTGGWNIYRLCIELLNWGVPPRKGSFKMSDELDIIEDEEKGDWLTHQALYDAINSYIQNLLKNDKEGR